MLETDVFWLLQLNEYWLYILLVLESFLLEHGKGTTKGGVDVPGMSFLLSEWSSLIEEEGMSL